MNRSISVLIIGAGPTGLMMACQLARYQIDFRIIDKKPVATQTTNAAVLHTRSLEILQQMGIAERFISIGLHCEGFRIHGVNGKILTELPFSKLDSRFPYSLFIPQNQTERLLGEYLEEIYVSVERQITCIDIQQTDQLVVSTLQHMNGEIETVKSEWVIGCDGFHSLVRDKSRILFSGEDLPEEYLVADMVLETPLTQNQGDGFLGNGDLLAFFPLGDQHYRVAAKRGGNHQANKITDDELKTIVETRTKNVFKTKSISWLSSFWIHSKIAEKIRQERIFIAGDAAHVHSPVGGQGMNTGIQDAFNLAWKLALVIKKQAPTSLLESYQAERYPVIKNLVKVTEVFTKIGTQSNFIFLKIRDFFIQSIIGSSSFLKRKLSRLITELEIQYQSSPIINYQTNIEYQAPKPGQRAPDIIIHSSIYLYDLLSSPFHYLLIFTGDQINPFQYQQLRKLQEFIDQNYATTIKCIVISPIKLTEFNLLIEDPQLKLTQRYGCMANGGICLIRPDLYIAMINSKFNKEKLRNFLKKYLI